MSGFGNSNTTNVKVKPIKSVGQNIVTIIQIQPMLRLNVKCSARRFTGLKHSNTTNVKVKRNNIYLCIFLYIYIQIQPMLRLN